MHPCCGLGTTSPADILLNNHVMLSPACKWIVKSRPQKLVPEAHWTSWLPLRAVNRDTWGPWLWGTVCWPGYGAPWETEPCLRCRPHLDPTVQECLLACRCKSRFRDIWTDTWETWKPVAIKWRQTAFTDELRMCTRLQFPHSLQNSFLPVQAHWRVVVATWHFHVLQRLQTWVFDKLQHTPPFVSNKRPTHIVPLLCSPSPMSSASSEETPLPPPPPPPGGGGDSAGPGTPTTPAPPPPPS